MHFTKPALLNGGSAEFLIDWELRPDGLHHIWLREAWLIAFVVPVAAVTDHIDDDISLEFLAEFQRKEVPGLSAWPLNSPPGLG